LPRQRRNPGPGVLRANSPPCVWGAGGEAGKAWASFLPGLWATPKERINHVRFRASFGGLGPLFIREAFPGRRRLRGVRSHDPALKLGLPRRNAPRAP